jgi:hypothetical protein
MTTVDRVDAICSTGDGWDPSGPPLLHLRGTEYGLRIHGLRIHGLRIEAVDRGEDLGESDRG